MRKVLLGCMLVVSAVSFFGVGCGASSSLMASGTDYERFANEGESEIFVTRLSRFGGVAATIHISVNGHEVLQLKDGENATIVVPNGTHTICGRNNYFEKDCSINAITLDLTSERAVLNVMLSPEREMIGLANITQVSQIPLGDN